MKKIKLALISLLCFVTWQSAWAERDNQNWDQLGTLAAHQSNLEKEFYVDHYRFKIRSAMDLACYVWLLNEQSKDGKYNAVEYPKYNKAELIILNDIDLDAHVWRAISEDARDAWKGSIDGRGHTIRNMHLYNNKDFSGLIDEIDEETTIKDLHFVDCDNWELANAKSILVGRVLNDKAKLKVENVSFTNCHMYAFDSSGLICGHVYQNGASVDIKNVTITNCSVKKNGVFNVKCTAAGIGYVKQSNVTATDVKIDGITLQGGEYVGGFIGWAEFGCKLQLDNIDIRNADIDGSRWMGGIVGEWQGAGFLKNSRWQGKLHSANSKESGGLIGKFQGNWTSVDIENCVADMRDDLCFPKNSNNNIGGAVGFSGGSAHYTLRHTSVLANSDNAGVPSNSQGLLIGNSESGCGISVENCHIDDWYNHKNRSLKIEEVAFGTGVRRLSVFSQKGITDLTTLDEGEKQLFYIAQINERGGRQGMGFTPLKDTEGMVVRYFTGSYASISSVKNPYNKSYKDYVMALVGDEITYTFTPQTGHWVVKDLSTGVVGSKCTGEGRFTAKPSADLKIPHKLRYYSVEKPKIAIKQAIFERERQATVLEWDIVNKDTIAKYWGPDGYWQILRDGQVIADEIPFKTMHYTDVNTPLGKQNKYQINLVSPSLHFNGQQAGEYTATILGEDNIELKATITDENTRRAIKVDMPNSIRFDGCRVNLYRLTTEDVEMAYNNIASLLVDAHRIAQTTYAFQAQSTQKLLPLTLYDDSNQRPCTMYHYYVVCDQFKDAYYTGRRIQSNPCVVSAAVSVKLTSMNAAKGESADKVKIDWTSRAVGSDLSDVTYKVWRKKYDPQTAGLNTAQDTVGWTMIYEVTNTYTTNSYTDQVLPGYVYKYMVRAYKGCDGVITDNRYESELTDIGYTASRGTIMGNIAYGAAKTNVEGVDVRLAADSLSMTGRGSTAYARYFTGQSDVLYLAPRLGSKFWQGNWTLQFLLRPLAEAADTAALLRIPGMQEFTLTDDTICIAGRKMAINANDYTRLLITHQDGKYKMGYAETPKETNDSYTHWVVEASDAELGGVLLRDTVVFGATEQLHSFQGMLDEVRLWNIALSETQVKSTYDRYLTGNESNLMAYYTFDSGVVEYAFDESHPDGIWNKRHTALPVYAEGGVLPGLRSDLCPSDLILCYRGTTDRNGEYQIAGIPFTGEGTNYMVVPIYGTHEFQPSSTRRYVSSQSLTHSSVDFNDISSFPVEIRAYYAMGNYPAEGLSVLIDGSSVTASDGKTIETDVNGRCTVNVPIGKHRLTLAGVNHTMVNQGYPCSIDSISEGGVVTFKSLQDADGYIDFQSTPVAPFTFFDNTYARVVGRVVGGNVESDKPLGANLSNANIGQVAITLEPSVRSGYQFNSSEVRDIQLDQKALGGENYNDVIQSTTTYQRASSDIVIKTDPKSGEFLALLPPVSMRIKDIHTTGSYGKLVWEDFNKGSQSDLITIDMKKEQMDSIKVNAKGQTLPQDQWRSFKYHAKKVYSYFVDPSIEVSNPSNEGGSYSQMLGDSVWVNRYEEIVGNDTIEVEDVVELWNKDLRDGSPQSYMLQNVPVFTMGNDYDLDISLFERYRSCDTGRDSLYFIPNVEIKITNTLATQKAEVKVTNDVMEYTLDTDSVEVAVPGSGNGKTRYTFTAGFPNSQAPYTLDLSMTYGTNGKVYTYPTEGTIKGIVMGYVNVPGTDFVTAGPDQVSFVLRDPPGGGSSAWIEQGSNITVSTTYENTNVTSTDHIFAAQTGTRKQVFQGNGAMGFVVLESAHESKEFSDQEGGITTSISGGTNRTAKLTYSVTKKLSTSGSSSYVGSSGDIYVGRSVNYVFSKSRILGLRKSSAGSLPGGKNMYALEQYDGASQTVNFATVFNYTQRHILQELIPGWRDLRRSCVDETVSTFEGLPEWVVGDKPRYYVLEGTSDKKDLWEHGVDYVCIYPASAKTGKGCHSDTISYFNNQISVWQQSIRNNEEIKVKTMRTKDHYTYTEEPDITTKLAAKAVTMDYGYLGNTSYDAGASMTTSITREANVTTGSLASITTQSVFNSKTKHETFLLMFGAKYQYKTNNKTGYSRKDNTSYSDTQKQTFGYTLSDSKPGNYFSVDTWLPGQMKGDGTLLELDKGGSPKLDEFFVFRLVGGQSRDPYEPEEYTLFYKEDGKPVKLSDGTIAIENPKITVSQPVFTDIPNGQKQAFNVTLSNESNANIKVGTGFTLNVQTSTNPDGLKFSIDGAPLLSSGGYEVFLTPGQSVQKTVIAEQTKLDVTHYENVELRFACSGEPGRAMSEKVSFHFKPASSPVTLAVAKPIVNSEVADTTVILTVSDYQPEFENFAGIRIQYKELTETDWHTATVLVNDSLLLDALYGKENFPQVWQYLDKKADRMLINLPMGRLADGTYLIRAQSFSPVGKTSEVTTESEEVSVLKDITAPTLFTLPTPEYGIYTGRENISIEMNEPIDMALLTENNFSVTGVLNDAEVRHMSGLHFDGDTPARTQSRVNVFGKSSSIAFWYKPEVRKNSCLLSQQISQLDGTSTNLGLFYNADATLTLKLGGKEYKSTLSAVDAEKRPIDDWMYATIIIDREKSEINVFNLFGTSTQAESHFLHIKDTNVSGDCNVPLYVGGSPKGDECHADMEELVLYNGAQTFATVASHKGNRHYDHLNILDGYWPMDEGENMSAADKVRSRNLVLQGTDNWYMPVTNYAVHFDGKSQYIKLHTEKCAISSQQNYALEFHFRTAKRELTDTLTLFSNGWGAAGSPEPSLKERLSLSLDTQGQILFCAAGYTTTLNGNFADQNWHHLVLDVNRTGYARVFVDGNDISGITNIGGSELGGLANATMTLGALSYYNGTDPQPVVGKYFEGDIDEVRLWNAHSVLETISDMANKRLTGNEVGLVAYYPFEHTTIVSNQPLTEMWLADCVMADEVTGIQPATDPEFVNNPTVAANGPRLKAAGIAQPIGFRFTHDDDKRIILSFPDNIDKKQLEGCTLTFSAKNLKDMAGNKMLQPVIWNIFVEQKSIVAWAETNSLKQDIGHSSETTLTIFNDNSIAQRWTLAGLPSWISAERTSNVIEPFSVQYVKLITDEATPVGNYSAALTVSGEDNLPNYINLDLNVTSVRPDWVAEKNGGNVWMSLMGRLKVDGAWSTDENDMVAAFTGDGRCLGVASPQYDESMNTYFLHMNIRGKSTDEGRMLKFHVWDASNDMIYTDTELSYVLNGQTHSAEDSLTLRSSKVLGNFNNPFTIATREVIRQNVSLHEGWNWISFWVEPKVGKKASDIFAAAADNLTEVKARTQGYHTDQLDKLSISLSQAYLVYAKDDVSFSVEGTKASPDTINMTLIHPKKTGDTRWHWLGYPVHTTLPLQTAFSDFLPSMDDVVKSEDDYAMYNGNTWIGSLKYMTPGKGYMYGYNAYGNQDVTWKYPAKVRANAEGRSGVDYTLDVEPYDYENYTFVQVNIEGLMMENGRYKLAAIGQDNYVHGVAENEGNSFYLSIYGNEGDSFCFTLLDCKTQEVTDFDVIYGFDAVTPSQIINITAPTGITTISADDAPKSWYRVDGVRVGSEMPSQKGIYIYNGKKLLK